MTTYATTILIAILICFTCLPGKAQEENSPSCNPYVSTIKTILFKEQRWLSIKKMNVSFYPERNRLIGGIGKSKAEISYVLGQPNAPIAVLMVGLGSSSTVGYARFLMDVLNRMGLTVISIPSSFNMKSSLAFSEYMRPGLSTQDAADLLEIIDVAVSQLTHVHHLSSPEKYLLGVSMGAFHVAAIFGDPKNEKLFSKYILINPPLELDYGIDVLDQLADGKGGLNPKKQSLLAKLIQLYLNEFDSFGFAEYFISLIQTYQMGEQELGRLIGMKMRNSVQQVIFASQQLRDDGVLKNKNGLKRLYESHTWRIRDYFTKIAWPFYSKAKSEPNISEDLSSRLTIWNDLHNARRPNDILILHSQDDFISRPSALLKLKEFPMHLVLTKCGGHVGALKYPMYLNPLKEFLEPR